MAAAVVTITTYGGSVKVIKMAWQSSDTGNATGTVFIDGLLQRMTTDPSATAPTADYDVTLIDDISGLDVLGGAGADRHTSTTEQVVPSMDTQDANEAMPLLYGNHTLTVANAGNTKLGDIYLYYR